MIRNWQNKYGKEYIKNYMRKYRLLTIIICISHTFFYAFFPLFSTEASWLEYKQEKGFEDYSGNIGLRGTYLKPPDYELSIKTGQYYFTLNRFLIRKGGWFPEQREEETDLFSEPKEAGAWSIEYGATGTTSETSLLESDSIYGWKIQLGQVSEILWGRGSYGDRVATASFNTEKFNFFATKSWGVSTQDLDYLFYESADTETSPNLPMQSAKPITKGEGGDLRVPFEWRGVRGDAEIAGRRWFDEEESEYKSGIAFAVNASAPKFIVSLRNITKGYESNIRTTDTSLKAFLYKTPETGVYTGYRLLDFSGDLDSRHGLTAGVQKKIYGINIGIDTELYKQGSDLGETITGGIGGTLYNTNINARRTEGITGYSTTTNNSLTVSRKQGSISFSQSRSTYLTNKVNNLQGNIWLNIMKDFKISLGAGESISENAKTKTTIGRFNCSMNFRDTVFTMNLSPTAENYTVTRGISVNKYGIGNTVLVGINYQRFVGGDGVTGSIGFSW